MLSARVPLGMLGRRASPCTPAAGGAAWPWGLSDSSASADGGAAGRTALGAGSQLAPEAGQPPSLCLAGGSVSRASFSHRPPTSCHCFFLILGDPVASSLPPPRTHTLSRIAQSPSLCHGHPHFSVPGPQRRFLFLCSLWTSSGRHLWALGQIRGLRGRNTGQLSAAPGQHLKETRAFGRAHRKGAQQASEEPPAAPGLGCTQAGPGCPGARPAPRSSGPGGLCWACDEQGLEGDRAS